MENTKKTIQLPNDEFKSVYETMMNFIYSVDEWDEYNTTNVVVGLLSAVITTIYTEASNDEQASETISQVLASGFMKDTMKNTKIWRGDGGSA